MPTTFDSGLFGWVANTITQDGGPVLAPRPMVEPRQAMLASLAEQTRAGAEALQWLPPGR